MSTMAHKRTKYTEEFKKQIIDLHLSGKPISQHAKEYGLIEQTVYKWKKLYAPSVEVDQEKSISQKDYLEMQKKIQQLEMENEILKKATAIFARKQ